MKKGMLKSAVLAMVLCGLGCGCALGAASTDSIIITTKDLTHSKSAESVLDCNDTKIGSVYGTDSIVVGKNNYVGQYDTTASKTYQANSSIVLGTSNKLYGTSTLSKSVLIGSSNEFSTGYTTVIGNDNKVVEQDGVKNIGNRTVVYGDSNIISNTYGVAIGQSNIVRGSYSNVIGYQSVAVGNHSTAIGYQATATGGIVTDKVNVEIDDGTGGKTIKSVTRQTQIVSFGHQYGDADRSGKGSSATGWSTVVLSRLKNVAKGIDPTDAVNVEQLEEAVAGAGSIVEYDDTNHWLDAGWNDSTVTRGKESAAYGYQAKATGDASVALGKGAQASKENSVALGAGSVADAENTVSVGSSSSRRKIVNVADGKANTDAATYGQLLASGTYDATTGTITFKNNAGSEAFSVAGITAGGGSGETYTAGDHIEISDNTISVKADGAVVGGNENIVTGDAVYQVMVAEGEYKLNSDGKTINVLRNDGTDAFVLNLEGLAGGSGAQYTAGDNVEISDDNVISVKADGKVEAGNMGIVTGGEVYDSMSGIRSDLEQKINKVGAGAAALAALHPETFDPSNKLNFAIGYGHYKNANAGAFGAFYKPNQDTTVSAGSTFGNGNPMVNMGVSFKIGKRGQSLAANASNAELVQEVNHLRAQNNRYEERIDAQEKKIADLEEKMQKLLQKVGKA